MVEGEAGAGGPWPPARMARVVWGSTFSVDAHVHALACGDGSRDSGGDGDGKLATRRHGSRTRPPRPNTNLLHSIQRTMQMGTMDKGHSNAPPMAREGPNSSTIDGT